MRIFSLPMAMVCAAGILAACSAPRNNLFVLLPEEDGAVGRISVTNPQGSQVLDRAWQGTVVAGPAAPPRAPTILGADEVRTMFKDALAAQPEPVRRFVLYFEKGSKELTAESQALMPQVLDAIAARKSVDTSVVGHTDTVGGNESNFRLSQERAAIIAKHLTDTGVDPEILEISSHGERNLLVPTADEVAEPRNRRVEITVR